MKRVLLLAAVGFQIACLQAKIVHLGSLWTMEVPDNWGYSKTEDKIGLRLYTFGIGAPLSNLSVPFFVVGKELKGCCPETIYGISIGVGLEHLNLVEKAGAQRITRESSDPRFRSAYRQEVDAGDGKLILNIFHFKAKTLPGKLLSAPDLRYVIVQIAAKTDAEIGQFIQVFETLKAAAPALP